MSGFSTLGVGSGLDLENLVNGLVRTQRQPVEARLARGESAARTRLSALGTLKSAIAGLANAIKGLQDVQVGLNASSSDAAKVGVSVGTEASAGAFEVRVSGLAAAQSLASAAFEDLNAPLGAGELVLTVGDETTTLEFSEDAASLGAVRDAINGSGLEVEAVVVRDGDQFRLLLTSGRSGLGGEMSLSAGGGLDARLDSASMAVTVPARDATFSVNGLELTSSANLIEEVVPGLTLTLKGETSDVVTVTVAADRNALRAKLDTLVTAYNRLADTMTTAGRADPEGGNSGPLVGDATLRAVQSRIGGAFSARLEGSTPAFSTLLDLGFATDINGRARLDADRLAAALEQDEGAVEGLLSSFAERFTAVLESFSGTGGILEMRTNSLNGDLGRIGAQREALARRMADVETRLRAQFTALDSILTQFQNTSAFLTQQLAGLAGLRSNS